MQQQQRVLVKLLDTRPHRRRPRMDRSVQYSCAKWITQNTGCKLQAERGCLVQFVRLANTLLNDEESA